MRIKEGSSRPGDPSIQLVYIALLQVESFVFLFGFNVAFPPVWSDDDWLKKFSGKTAEEADAQAASGETPNTASQEVRGLSVKVCLCVCGVNHVVM